MAYLHEIGHLSVGVPAIDDEHLEFLTICDRIDEVAALVGLRQAMAEHMPALIKHCFDHFSHEEKILKEIGYNTAHAFDYGVHVDEHNRLKQRFRAYMAASCDDDLHMASVGTRLKASLLDHLIRCDMRYKSYLQELEASATCAPARSG